MFIPPGQYECAHPAQTNTLGLQSKPGDFCEEFQHHRRGQLLRRDQKPRVGKILHFNVTLHYKTSHIGQCFQT